MIDDENIQVCATGVHGPLRLEDVLMYAKKANRIGSLQVVDAGKVVGWDHLRSAALHATRSIDEGRAEADRPEVEFLRYVAGERQIARSLRKMGLQDGADAAIIVGLGPKRLDAARYFCHALGFDEDDALVAVTPERLQAFGVDPADPMAEDHVLEAVARVDLLKTLRPR